MAFLHPGKSIAKTHSLFARTGGTGSRTDSKTSPRTSSEDDKDIITLNVGGQVFKTYIPTILRIKSSRLDSIAQRAISNSCCEQEYFFDRNPEVFAAILDYCRSQELHLPRNICSLYFRGELEFWGISENEISDCCKQTYFDHVDEISVNAALATEFLALKPRPKSTSDSYRNKIYETLQYPDASNYAKIWAVVHYLLVVVTILNVFLSTVPQCRVPVDGAYLPPLFNVEHDHDNHNTTSTTGNSTASSQTTPLTASEYLLKQLETNVKVRMLVTTDKAKAIQYLDMFCLFFFTIEFVVRIITAPSMLMMFKKFFTYCDLLYLIPGWILYIVEWVDYKYWRQPEHIIAYLLLECFIVARVLRLFRVANHYRGLRILVLSLRASMGELFLLFIFVAFAMVVFSALIYCVEIFILGSFDNMFYGLWWSLITMTTVGYGDSVPKSGFGYLVASLCAMTGIILIGMIVPIITSNFHKYYGFRNDSVIIQPVELAEPNTVETVLEETGMEMGKSGNNGSNRLKSQSIEVSTLPIRTATPTKSA